MLVALILSFLIFPMGGSATDQIANQKEAIKISNEALANYIQYGLTEKNAATFGFKISTTRKRPASASLIRSRCSIFQP